MDKPIETMNQDELTTLQYATEHNLREANDNLALCDQYDLSLARKIILINLERNEYKDKISKAENVVKNCNSLLREIKGRWWEKKNG